MKKIESALEWLFWPFMVLFLGDKAKTSFRSRLGFSAIGILNIVLLAVTAWFALDFFASATGVGLVFAAEAVVLAAFYLFGHYVYLSKHKRRPDEQLSGNVKPVPGAAISQSRKISRSGSLTTSDIVDTLKRMEAHGKKARVAWCLSQGGGIFVFPDP